MDILPYWVVVVVVVSMNMLTIAKVELHLKFCVAYIHQGLYMSINLAATWQLRILLSSSFFVTFNFIMV